MSISLTEKDKFIAPNDLGNKCPEEDVHRFILECMMVVGVPKENSILAAQVLVEADKRGHFSHGLQRTEKYLNDVMKKICDANAVPAIVKESVSTALVNGNNGLGPVVSKFCMDLAIQKAKETGIGWVSCTRSNHNGIAGMWSMQAAKQGMIGLAFTNSSPHVVPTRGKTPVLGTNPISLAAPAKGGDFVLDMATSVVSNGKLEMKMRENKPLPENWSLDVKGQPTTDARTGLSGALLPLGGTEENSSYKGFGLCFMVEILCGIMSGGPYGPHMRSLTKTDRPQETSHCFVAINPGCFASGFEERLTDLMNHCRNLEPTDPNKRVLVAGDPERLHCQKVETEGGITYPINLIKEMWKLAQYLGVKPLQTVA